jgi:hypothetical protein
VQVPVQEDQEVDEVVRPGPLDEKISGSEAASSLRASASRRVPPSALPTTMAPGGRIRASPSSAWREGPTSATLSVAVPDGCSVMG